MDLTVKQKAGQDDLAFPAGEECKNAPDGWPPKWVVDQGLVEPFEEDQKAKPKPIPVPGKTENEGGV